MLLMAGFFPPFFVQSRSLTDLPACAPDCLPKNTATGPQNGLPGRPPEPFRDGSTRRATGKSIFLRDRLLTRGATIRCHAFSSKMRK